MTTRSDTNKLTWALRRTAIGLGLLFALAACGSVEASDVAGSNIAGSNTAGSDVDDDRQVGDATPTDAAPVNIVFEEPGVPGADPFTVSVSLTTPSGEQDQRVGPGLYGGTGENTVCDADLLVNSLAAQPEKAAAWADAVGIETSEVADYVEGLHPQVLTVDTRVTNHGYRDGSAQPFQSTLGAGTAVLVDASGTPRTRCACGNPLDEPLVTPDTTNDVPTTPTQPVDDVPQAGPGQSDEGEQDNGQPPVVIVPSFCGVWAEVRPAMTGGPSGPGPDALALYLTALSDGLAQLIEAAEATDGFPADALADLQDYHALIEAAIAEGGVPGPGDAALRDRVEGFLGSYCESPNLQTPGTDDDAGTDADDPDEAGDDTPTGNCGSMQFSLLVAAADGVGIDHAAVSTFYIEALQAVLDGVDPGEEFDVGDLSPMLAYEAVGCAGAQAMQQLFTDAGLGHLLEGTELDG